MQIEIGILLARKSPSFQAGVFGGSVTLPQKHNHPKIVEKRLEFRRREPACLDWPTPKSGLLERSRQTWIAVIHSSGTV